MDTEIIVKENELQALIDSREKDQQRLELTVKKTKEARDFVKFTIEERDRLRKAKERMRLENAMAIKIQAWWRMTMVLKCLGPFKKRKKQMQAAQAAKQQGKKRK